MKIQFDINNISGKNKLLCIGDLIRYYGETKYKMIEGVERLNQSKTTKGMVAKLLKKAMNNPMADAMLGNLEEISKQKFFYFTVDDKDPVKFDNGRESCTITVEMREEYFLAKAIYDMMKPGFRKMEYLDYVAKEKQEWLKFFEKNLKEYSKSYTYKIVEK